MIKAKVLASGIHLVFSLLILLAFTIVIYYAWYPEPYFSISGGLQGIRLIAGAFLVVGPLTTLIIFSPTKSKHAKILDYSLIVTAQIAVLAWGTYTVYNQRPMAIVYHDGFFDAVVEESLGEQIATLDLDALREKSEESPPLLFVREPTTDEIPGVIIWNITEGIPRHHLVFLYDDFRPHLEQLDRESIQHLAKLESKPVDQNKLKYFLSANNLEQDDIVLTLFKGLYGNAWLVMSNNGKLLGTVIHMD